MLYNELGKTGVKVSRLGLGCMRLPLNPSKAGEEPNQSDVDIKASLEMIDVAIQQGINYIDTAYVYHNNVSENILGDALEQLNARKKIHLATKLPPWDLKEQGDLERIFEEQCKKLKTDYIDFYLLHNINTQTLPNFEKFKAIEFIHKLKKEGRIGFAGFSFHDSIDLFDKALQLFDWDFCQIQYNFIDQHYQAGEAGLKKAVAQGLGVVIMEPLKGGALARKQPDPVEALWTHLGSTSTPADRSLRWLFDQPEVSLVLSGMNSNEQLLENIKSAAHVPHTMSKQEYLCFEKARAYYQENQKVPCTSCNYCMPCPANVNIPGIFTLYNHTHLFNTGKYSQFVYNDIMSAQNAQASQCVECGVCMEHCPQGIKIPDQLKLAHQELLRT